MRKLLLILCLGFFSFGCSQKEKTLVGKDMKLTYNINDYIFPEAKDITTSNFVEKLNSEIKHFDAEPIYYFRINKQNCIIEIKVNDVYSFDDYEISNLITPIEINQILKSGQQKITIKMYPVGNLNNESWGKETEAPMTELTENSSVEIIVVSIDEKSNKGFDDEKIIAKQVSPKDVAGKKVYEFSFTFNAQVPYEFEGWTKGQDLHKLDQELVRKKAEEFYKMVGNIMVDKNLDSWLKLNYVSDIRLMGTSYVSKDYLNGLLEEYKKDTIRDYSIDFQKYTFDYMANGKLLRLITDNPNPEFKNSDPLFLKYGKSGIYIPSVILYLPEGRDLATQGFMMWK